MTSKVLQEVLKVQKMSVPATKMFASIEQLRSPRGAERELLLVVILMIILLIIVMNILLIKVMIILIMAHISKYAAAATKHFERES